MHQQWHRLDMIGGSLSVLCAVHCILTPILVSSLPFLGYAAVDSALGASLIAVASLAIVGGAAQHGRFTALIPYAAGVAVFFARNLVGEHGSTAETMMLVLASGFFLAAHLINFRLCRTEEAIGRPH